mgnify:CR=1 FL=1
MTTLFYLLIGFSAGYFANLCWDLVKMFRARRADRHLVAGPMKCKVCGLKEVYDDGIELRSNISAAFEMCYPCLIASWRRYGWLTAGGSKRKED